MSENSYDSSSIKVLKGLDAVRKRPGMYIGDTDDGTGLHHMVFEVVDNSIDEHMMGHGKAIDVKISDHRVEVRDYGRGIPLGKVIDCVSKINTGGKYDSGAFQKSVGLNGVGTKAVNALSSKFMVTSYRDGKQKKAAFHQGMLVDESALLDASESNGTWVYFEPDPDIFRNFRFRKEFIENQLWNYAYLNAGLKLIFNGTTIVSKNGLLDLLERKTKNDELRYPIIHLKGEDIELAITHGNQYGELYYSFVNLLYKVLIYVNRAYNIIGLTNLILSTF